MIIKLKVRYYGEECLRIKSDALKECDAAHLMVAKVMIKTMYETDGVGLAAPQVGINERFFVMDIGDGPIVVVNPKILDEFGQAEMEEGCLSCPGITVPVKRAKKIKVKYIDSNNNIVERELNNLMARVFLHEFDHLNGITIIERSPAKDRKNLGNKVKEFLSNHEKKQQKHELS